MQCEKGSHSVETKIKCQPYFLNPPAKNSLQKTPIFLKSQIKRKASPKAMEINKTQEKVTLHGWHLFTSITRNRHVLCSQDRRQNPSFLGYSATRDSREGDSILLNLRLSKYSMRGNTGPLYLSSFFQTEIFICFLNR